MCLINLNVLPHLSFPPHLIFTSILPGKHGIIFYRLTVTPCSRSHFRNNILNQYVITFTLQGTINYYIFALLFSEIYKRCRKVASEKEVHLTNQQDGEKHRSLGLLARVRKGIGTEYFPAAFPPASPTPMISVNSAYIFFSIQYCMPFS